MSVLETIKLLIKSLNYHSEQFFLNELRLLEKEKRLDLEKIVNLELNDKC